MKFAVILTLILLTAAACSSQDRIIPSTDRLPLGDWTYDAMISLAADGLVPGRPARLFQGDRRYTRMEMAALTADVIRQDQPLTAGSATLVGRLVSEFRPELLAVDPGVLDLWAERETGAQQTSVHFTGYARGLLTHDDETRLRLPHRLTAFADLSDRCFASVSVADREEKFFQEMRDSPLPDKLFARGYHRNLTWSVGREYLNWGPSYTGSTILSDNSRAFLQARGSAEVDFGKVLGRVKITQFISRYGDVDANVNLFGRRYERPLSDRWQLGISETAKTNFTPNPLILVLPFYAYQHIFKKPGNEVDEGFNAIYALDLTYTADNVQLYGQLAVDDMTAPSIVGGGFDRPRKFAYTLGVYVPRVLCKETSTFRAEFVIVDPETYGATRPEYPELAYTHKGDIIGHPLGPNSKAVYLRGEQSLSNSFSLIGEFLDDRQKEDVLPSRGRRKFASLMGAYDIAPDKSVALRITPYRIVLPEGNSFTDTRYQLMATFAF